MNRAHPPSFALLPYLLVVLVICGCASRHGSVPRSRTAEDAIFIRDLRSSGAKGTRGICVVAPASALSGAAASEARELARALGVQLPEEALAPGPVPYNAHCDAVRLSLLTDALLDPECEVVWALSGGYGSSRLLPLLAQVKDRLRPKVVIGYSDITFLHLFLQRAGWRTVHGSMFTELRNPAKDPENFRLLASLLAGRTRELRYSGLVPCNKAAKEYTGAIRASITGGNLTCLAGASGTPWSLEADGKILFLEDVKEPGYKIDRLLTQLRQSGALTGMRAVILGGFTGGDEHTEFALARFADTLQVPVVRTDLFGHGPKNYPLVFNTPAVLEKTDGDRYSLRMASPVESFHFNDATTGNGRAKGRDGD